MPVPHIVDWWYRGRKKYLQFNATKSELQDIIALLDAKGLRHGAPEQAQYAASDRRLYRWYCSLFGYWETLEACRAEVAQALGRTRDHGGAGPPVDSGSGPVVLVETLELKKLSKARLQAYMRRIDSSGGRVDACLVTWRVGKIPVADEIALDLASTLDNLAVLNVLMALLDAAPACQLDLTFGALRFPDRASLERFANGIPRHLIPLTPTNVRAAPVAVSGSAWPHGQWGGKVETRKSSKSFSRRR